MNVPHLAGGQFHCESSGCRMHAHRILSDQGQNAETAARTHITTPTTSL
jgi:hypothetical protein